MKYSWLNHCFEELAYILYHATIMTMFVCDQVFNSRFNVHISDFINYGL